MTAPSPCLRTLHVRATGPHAGVLSAGPRAWPCVLGRGGVHIKRQEGDGITPVGRFALRGLYWRADRGPRPHTRLPGRRTRRSDGWCDDPPHPCYNRWVPLPFPARHEALWRTDGLYDLVVVFGANDRPVVPGRGSALFLHVMRPERTPTEGCVALTAPALRAVLARVARGTVLWIHPHRAAPRRLPWGDHQARGATSTR